MKNICKTHLPPLRQRVCYAFIYAARPPIRAVDGPHALARSRPGRRFLRPSIRVQRQCAFSRACAAAREAWSIEEHAVHKRLRRRDDGSISWTNASFVRHRKISKWRKNCNRIEVSTHGSEREIWSLKCWLSGREGENEREGERMKEREQQEKRESKASSVLDTYAAAS